MKKLLRICLLLFLAVTSLTTLSYAQSPNWSWLKRIGGTGVGGGNDYPDEQVSDIRTDAQGNVYVCGRIRKGADFNGAPMTTYSVSAYDIFVAKLDCAGNLLWVKTAGGNNSNAYANSLAVDDVGNVYVTGYLSASNLIPVTFGNMTITETTSDIFLAKYTTHGDLSWVKLAAPGSATIVSVGTKIRIDAIGNVHMLAFSNNGVLYPGFSVQQGYLIARFDTSGTPQQVLQLGNPQAPISAFDFTISGGDYYFTGSFGMDSAMVCNQTLFRMSPGSGSDIYVAKMDTSGNCQWLRHFGNSQIFNYSSGTGLAFLDDKLILSGIVVSGTMLDSFILTSQLHVNPRSVGFIAALDTTTGAVSWANNLHVKFAPADPGLGVTVLPDNSIALAGYFNAQLAAGSDTLNSVSYDMYLARMNSSGNWIGLSSIPGSGSDEVPKCITSDHLGNIYVGGGFDGTLNFNGTGITNVGGHSDAFVARFGYSGTCTVGIDETLHANSTSNLFVYPNPARDRINLRGITENGILEMYDMAGRKVFSLPVNVQDGDRELLLPTVQAGLYLLRFVNEKTSLSTRIIIE